MTANAWSQDPAAAQLDRSQSLVDARSEPPVALAAEEPTTVVLREFLLLPRVGQYGRRLVAQDPVQAALVAGQWAAPSAGDEVTSATGQSVRWRSAKANSLGQLNTSSAVGGYAYATFDSPSDRVLLLQATRHASVCVNGNWYTGDPYGWGYVKLPIELRKGPNELLFHLASSPFSAELSPPNGAAYLLAENATLPSLVHNSQAELVAGLPVVNATNQPLSGLKLVCQIGSQSPTVTNLPELAPLAVWKATLRLQPSSTSENLTPTLSVRLVQGSETQPPTLDQAELSMQRVAEQDSRTCTFVSRVDGSVQPYQLTPAVEASEREQPPGILLALHSAGVGIQEHAARYTPKNWAYVVAPYNRGSAGFDWEDWGRIDALEALADAQQRVASDPQRVYVTGHAMGGHGAWRLGVLHPDKFAAVGPSAGWISHWTYGGGMPAYEQPTATQAMLLRAAAISDTAKLTSNLAPVGVYVLHGDRDAQIGVSQSRFMRDKLGAFHTDFAYRERRGAGAWWGNACCDWPDMMQFFQQRTRPLTADVVRVRFTTPDISVSAGSHWARVETQEQQGKASQLDLRLDKKQLLYRGSTTNVRRLSLDASFLPADQPVRVQLDESPIVATRAGSQGRVYLSRDRRGRWNQAPPPPGSKHPGRAGGFKSVFDNRALLVYGTAGTKQENAWAAAKARFDSQCFWYRGNGALQVLPDHQFDPTKDLDRNVVLYGNAETNRAWPALLSTCPVQVRAGQISISSHGAVRPERGPGLAALFVYPRSGSHHALVGVVAGAGLPGMRATDRVRYFYSGVHLPDLLLLGPRLGEVGDADIRAAGYFGYDWRVESGEIVWRDLAL